MEIFFNQQGLIEDVLQDMRTADILYREFTPNRRTRWDSISHGFWSNPWLYELLTRANPDLLNKRFIEPGEVVLVPEIPERPWVDPNSLPPWDPRRQQWRS